MTKDEKKSSHMEKSKDKQDLQRIINQCRNITA